MKYNYHVVVTKAEGECACGEACGKPAADEAIAFDFDSHDDLFRIVGLLKEKNLFEREKDTLQLALGLKLMGGILIANRKRPPFDELADAFGKFMRAFKAQMKAGDEKIGPDCANEPREGCGCPHPYD